MRANYTVNSGVRFRMLSDDQLQELYDGVLHVLEYTCLDVYHEQAREILKEAGAWVDGIRVRIPSYIVRHSLDLAPRSFTIFSRDGNPEHDIHIGPGRGHFGPGPTCPNFIDVESLERRLYVKSDVPLVAKTVDALPNIDFCESLGTVNDVHHDLGALYEFAGMFPNTSKPIVAWSYDKYDSAGIHEIAVAEAGGQAAFELRPNYVHYCEPLSPLVSTEEALDKLIFAAENRVPLIFTPCPISGGTAPVSSAGVIIQHPLPNFGWYRTSLISRCHYSGRSRILDGFGDCASIATRAAIFHGRRVFHYGYERNDPLLWCARNGAQHGWIN